MATKKSNLVEFNPTEALAFNDMQDFQKALTQRAWEFPDYSNVLSVAKFVGSGYSAAFGTPTPLRKVVFTKGCGLEHAFSGFNLTIYAGFIGTYNADIPPPEFDASAPTPAMRWCYSTGESFAGLANPGGSLERYDLIQAKIDEVASTPVTRHFRDSATGALSSISVNKRRSLSPTISLKPGVAAAAGSAAVPAPDAGYAAISYVRVTSAGIQEAYDCTVPFGPLRETVIFGSQMVLGGGATLDAGGGFVTLSASVVPSFAEAQVGSGARERILGVALTHSLQTTGANTNRVLFSLWNRFGFAPAYQQIVNDTAFTCDGTVRDQMFNMLGPPLASGGVIMHPRWGTGEYKKSETLISNLGAMTVRVVSDSANAKIVHGLRVYSVIG